MSNIIELIVDEEFSNERLDLFVCANFEEFSRSKIQKFIKENIILLNGKKAKVATILKEGDVVRFDKPDGKIIIKAQEIELDIRYEDDDMLVVNKPKNMLTHPTSLETENTLVNALLYKYENNLSTINVCTAGCTSAFTCSNSISSEKILSAILALSISPSVATTSSPSSSTSASKQGVPFRFTRCATSSASQISHL